MADKYVFDEDHVTALKNAKDADPAKIGRALAQIMEENSGRLEPQMVVSAAASPRHPLHKFFTWRDDEAAARWRLHEARGIIRSVKIVREDGDRPLPAFVSLHDLHGTSYRSVAEIQSSRDLQRRVLIQAERDLEAFTELTSSTPFRDNSDSRQLPCSSPLVTNPADRVSMVVEE